MSVGPVTAFASSPPPAVVQAAVPVRAVTLVSASQPVESTALGPAVSLKIGAEPAEASSKNAPSSEASTESRGFVRDAESQALVYQVVDPASGDIVVQIPDEVVLKARAFAREIAANQAASQAPSPGSAIEKRA